MKSITISTNVLIYKIDECNDQTKKLIKHAQNASANAYAPYSNYYVGAAVLLGNGQIITGNNQENVAYPSGLCAERTAIFYANAQYPEERVEAIAIAAYFDGDFTANICTPCGSCRQVLAEVENKYKHPVRILLCSKEEVYEVESIRDLLPLSFDF